MGVSEGWARPTMGTLGSPPPDPQHFILGSQPEAGSGRETPGHRSVWHPRGSGNHDTTVQMTWSQTFCGFTKPFKYKMSFGKSSEIAKAPGEGGITVAFRVLILRDGGGLCPGASTPTSLSQARVLRGRDCLLRRCP